MPRVKIGSAIPDRKALDGEIARLRDLDVSALRATIARGRRWLNELVDDAKPTSKAPRSARNAACAKST